jgi:hypothetical protein
LRCGSASAGAKITVPGDAVVDLDNWRTVWKQPVYRVPQHLLSMRSARIVLGTWSA